jgi:predicted acetyltransferase
VGTVAYSLLQQKLNTPHSVEQWNKERIMMQATKMESTDRLAKLKKQYMKHTTAPLDGMWLCGFVPMASHFGFCEDNELVGFFCVNDEGYLLQFFMNQKYHSQSSQLFESILHRDDSPTGKIKGAFVSTAEPDYLSLCLDRFSQFEVNALMYQRDGVSKEEPQENALTLTTVESSQLPEAVDFAVASIGASAEWLNGYFTNLINRRELFGVWENGRLVATGESRGYDEYQTGYADLGVIITESERGRGMATQVLRQLIAMNEAKGLKSICSTEKTNIAAQKAIGRAGFFARNRILQLHA